MMALRVEGVVTLRMKPWLPHRREWFVERMAPVGRREKKREETENTISTCMQ